MDNEIVFDPSVEGTNNNVRGLNINLGPVRRIGADFSWFYTSDKWGVSTQVAYVQTEIRSGENDGSEVPLVPSLYTINQAWYKPLNNLRIKLVHRYVGEQFQGGDFDNSQRRVDSYNLINCSADFQVNSYCNVYLRVTNIFDELYAEGVFLGSYYPGQGRSVLAAVNLSF